MTSSLTFDPKGMRNKNVEVNNWAWHGCFFFGINLDKC